MNIVLIPHNWTRHVVVAFYTGAVPLLIWWFLLNWLVVLGPYLFPSNLLYMAEAEGPILFSLMAGGIAATHISAEGGLRRRALLWNILLPFLAFLLAALFTCLLIVGIEMGTGFIVDAIDKDYGVVYWSPYTVTLRHRLLEWVAAGTIIGLTTLAIRTVWAFIGPLAAMIPQDKIPEMVWNIVELPASPPRVSIWMAIDHILAGPTAALVGAAVWHFFGYIFIKDLYLASCFGFTTFGATFGLLAWGVPSDLYAGWIRILSSHRFGHRIPIDTPAGGPVERVLGHYPRGLDLWVGAEHGVAELHTSFVVDQKGGYAVRGLSIQPVSLKRSLESIDLAYEPTSPVPLEADLRMEDRILIGPKGQQTHVEFILLPKEER